MNAGDRIRVAIASSSPLALPTVEKVSVLSEVNLVGFISNPDRPKGRSGRPTANEFAEAISKRELPVHKPESDEELNDAIASLKPDLVIVIAYGRIVKRDALQMPKFGWVNLHFSMLPAFRGAAPVQRTLMAGSRDFGFTIFRLDEGMDTGPFFVREKVEMNSSLCATEVLEHLAGVAADRFEQVIGDLLNSRSPQEQRGDGSLAPKIRKEELFLDLSGDGRELFQRIQGLTRKPGPWFRYEDKRIVINKAVVAEEEVVPLHFMAKGDRFLLGLNGLTIELISLTPEGRREMNGIDFARGSRLPDGQLVRIS